MTFHGRDQEVEVRIHDPDTVGQVAFALFGRQLTLREWSEAVGAPDGATVRVAAEPTAREGRGEIVILTTHPLFAEEMERRFFRAAEGALVCRNERFTLQPWARRRGIGSTVFARQVDALRRLGVARIEAEIAGRSGSGYDGYYRWALMGYDAPLTPDEQRRLPPELAGARTLHELVIAPAATGVAWWKRHGSGREAVFDLSPDSPHSAILSTYLAERER